MVAQQQGSRFQQVLEAYDDLEPGTSDAWNPLHSELELAHRNQLFRELAGALRGSGVNIADTQVADVGCGTGRSTRMYLELGFTPEQLCGIDLRPGAIERAKRLHPAIRFLAYDGERVPFDDGAFDWVSMCGVLSSVPAGDPRRHLVGEVRRVLRPGGYFFYWDLVRTLGFAGKDVIDYERLFRPLTLVQVRAAYVEGSGGPRFARLLAATQRLLPAPLPRRATHRAALFRKES